MEKHEVIEISVLRLDHQKNSILIFYMALRLYNLIADAEPSGSVGQRILIQGIFKPFQSQSRHALLQRHKRDISSMLLFPVNVLERVLDKVDMVLIMSVNPGFGGQKYIPETARKLQEMRRMLDATGNSEVLIQVDGGINEKTVDEVLEAGANIIVAGSAVFGGDIEKNIRMFQDHIDPYNSRDDR